jgi:uncharacterized membrane protein
MGHSNLLRRLQLISAGLALIGLADSLYLWSFKLTGQLICTVGGCEAVNSSPYSELLGVPVAAIGAAGYASLVALALWAFFGNDNAPVWLTDLRTLFAGIGLFFAAYLTGIELFVLHAICQWCVVSATTITVLFLCLLFERRREQLLTTVAEEQ